MIHYFDIGHAQEHGVIEAVLIQNLSFWISHNKANNTHFYQGRTWTYNTIAAFGELFPYLSTSQIRRAMDGLIAKGVVLAGNFNARAVDRTKWYAFADECNFLIQQVHLPIPANAVAGFGKSLTRTDGNQQKVNADRPDGARASRLAPDWTLPKSWGDWALAEFPSWTADYVRLVAEKFHDHWIAQPKSKGVKADWLATWRNWCRNEPGPKKEGAGTGGAWWASEASIKAKGASMGMRPIGNESWQDFKSRIQAAIDNGGVPPSAGPSRLPQPYTPLPEDGGPPEDDAPPEHVDPPQDGPPRKGGGGVQAVIENLKVLTNVRPKRQDPPHDQA